MQTIQGLKVNNRKIFKSKIKSRLLDKKNIHKVILQPLTNLKFYHELKIKNLKLNLCLNELCLLVNSSINNTKKEIIFPITNRYEVLCN